MMEVELIWQKVSSQEAADVLQDKINKFLKGLTIPTQFVTVELIPMGSEVVLAKVSVKAPREEPPLETLFQNDSKKKGDMSLHDGIGYNGKYADVSIKVADGKYEYYKVKELEAENWCISYPKGSKVFFKVERNKFKRADSPSKIPDYFVTRVKEGFENANDVTLVTVEEKVV